MIERQHTGDTPGPFRITDDAGELLRDLDTGAALVFDPADYAKGQMGALYQAARKAGALQRSGRLVRLEGPGERRRYAPEYLDLKGAKRWPYRIPCSVFGCPNWIHPVQVNAGATCVDHFAQSETLQEAARRMNEARGKKPGVDA